MIISQVKTMKDKLLCLVEEEGIYLLHWDFPPPVNGFYYQEAGSVPAIGIASRIKDNSPLYTCVLAEELGHYYTSTGVHPPVARFSYAERLNVSRSEYIAQKWAALKLMPAEKVRQALTAGIREVWELAEEFGVTEDLVRFRMGMEDYL
jgi:Zn-dependent peptidase ImmA (M78 family)